MDFINREALSLTMQSYTDAVNKLFDVYPRMKPLYTDSKFALPLRWYYDHATNDWAQHATKLFTNTPSLFEWGHPVKDNGWRNFLTLEVYMEVPFTTHTVDYARASVAPYVDDDGEEHPGRPYIPEQLRTHNATLLLRLYQKQWHLRGYLDNRSEIERLFIGASFEILNQWLRALNACDAEIDKYKEAVRKETEKMLKFIT